VPAFVGGIERAAAGELGHALIKSAAPPGKALARFPNLLQFRTDRTSRPARSMSI
jgi:hypothetical protein